MWVRVLLGVIGLVGVGAGCGASLSEYGGSYEGTLKSTDKEGPLTYMKEETRFVHVSEAADGGLMVQVRDECVVPATLDGDALTLTSSRCVFDYDSYGMDAQVTGSGVLDVEAQTLSLSFKLVGTIKRAGATLTLDSANSFEGERR